MATLTKQQAIDYAKTITFGLKDYAKTEGKYRNYRKDVDLVFQGETRRGGQKLDYVCELMDYVDQQISSGLGYMNMLGQRVAKEGRSKSTIRELKTCINSATYENNKRFIERYHDDLTLPKFHRFTERYYIENYEAINEAMQEIFLNCINERETNGAGEK